MITSQCSEGKHDSCPVFTKDDNGNPTRCQCNCEHPSETDIGSTSSIVEEEKQKRGITPDIEEQMIESGEM